MIIIYLQSATPSKAEEKLAHSMNKVSLRNARKWKGEIEPCDMVYTDSAAVRSAYEEAGIEAKPVTSRAPKPKPRKPKSNG